MRRIKNNDIAIAEHARAIKAEELKKFDKENESILSYIVLCSQSSRPYRIVKAERKFYQKMNIPLPTEHPDIRLEKRIAQVAKPILFVHKKEKEKEDENEYILSSQKTSEKKKILNKKDYDKLIF